MRRKKRFCLSCLEPNLNNFVYLMILVNFIFTTFYPFFRLARGKDVQAIFDIVKAAYSVELGDSGVAFKNADRYTNLKSVSEDLPFIWVLRDGGDVVGCVKGVKSYNGKVVEIGPVAVKPDLQVSLLTASIFSFLVY